MADQHAGLTVPPDPNIGPVPDRTELRQRIAAMRLARKALQQSHPRIQLTLTSAPRLEAEQNGGLGIRASAEASQARNSGEEEEEVDYEATILGHLSAVVVNPDDAPMASKSSAKEPGLRRGSRTSQQTVSSNASTSRGSISLDDDLDGQSIHTLTTVDENSDHASRKGASRSNSQKSMRQSRLSASSMRSVSSSSASTRPLGPPPDIPLPPKPLNLPCLQSPITGWSYGAHSPWSGSKSSYGSRPSTVDKASPGVSDSELSDNSADEIKSIRRISAHFPPPRSRPLISRPSTACSINGRNVSSTRSRAPSRNGEVPPSHLSSPRFPMPLRSPLSPWSPAMPSPASRFERNQKEALGGMKEEAEQDLASSRDADVDGYGDNSGTYDSDDGNESDLSDVLRMTATEGVLAVRQRARSVSIDELARIGLGSGSPDQSPPRLAARLSNDATGPGSVSEAVSEQLSRSAAPKNGSWNANASSTTMDGLVAVLDQEAARWSLDSAANPSQLKRRPESGQDVRSLVQLPAVVDSEAPLQESADAPDGAKAVVTLQSDSSLEPSETGALPMAADERSQAKSAATQDPPVPNHDTSATCHSAPALLVEAADGSEASLSDLDFTTDDDAPRKRSKQAKRRGGYGFDDQRASLNSTLSSRSLQPGQLFNLTSHQTVAASTRPEATDPYLFYEFSPSLPPTVPIGLRPKDLTGTGTWSSIVARAAHSSLSRQVSICTTSSLSTTGPVSLKEVAAGARARQAEAEAARKARESQSELFRSLSYRPFEIHEHAKKEAKALDRNSIGEMTSGRNTSMSVLSTSSAMSDLATKWPVAIGQGDQESDEARRSDLSAARSSLVGLGIATQASSAPAKVYAEFSMQTSPSPTPPVSPTTLAPPPPDASSSADPNETPRADKRQRAPTRRRTMAALSSAYGIDLDSPGLQAPRTRAPRLSSRKSEICLQPRRLGVPARESFVSGAKEMPESSSDESDLDVGAPLEEVADRIGMLDEVRGSKRKQRRSGTAVSSSNSSRASRPIAMIPSRISAKASSAASLSPRRRANSSTGWTSSEDESDEDAAAAAAAAPEAQPFSTPPPARGSSAFQLRPLLLPRSVPAKAGRKRISSLRDSALEARCLALGRIPPRATRASSLRSASPDFSILTYAGEDENDSLMAAELDLSNASAAFLNDDAEPSTIPARLRTWSDAAPLRPAATAARADPCEEAIETLNGTDEEFSNQRDKGVPSSAGHESFSEACGTSGHDPQSRPNEVLAEMVRQRLALRLEGALSGSSTILKRFAGADGETAPPSLLEVRDRMDEAEDGATSLERSPVARGPATESSPVIQDTPDTLASSGVWSMYRTNGRDSSGSTATTWSETSFVEERRQSTAADEPMAKILPEAVVKDALDAGAQPAPTAEAPGTTDPVAQTAAEAKQASLFSTPARLQRKASGLPMLASNRRSASETVPVKRSEGTVDAGSRHSSKEASAAAPSTTSSIASKKAQRPSLPPPTSFARSAAALQGSGSPGPEVQVTRLRKMKSFGDRSSNGFIAPPLSSLPRAIPSPGAKAPTTLKQPSGVPRTTTPTTAGAANKQASTLPRKSGIPAPASTAGPRLHRQSSMQSLSRLPAPSTLLRRPALDVQASGLPTPKGLRPTQP
ncbi:hypothetical protein ACQY0O_005043 [Thecaphora frezii]